MKRTLWILTVLFMCGGILLASGTKEQTKAKIGGTLEFWTFVDPKGDSVRNKAHAYVEQKFMEKYPEVDLKVSVIKWDQLDSMLIRAVQSNRPPDISMIYHPSLEMHVNAGTIQPLDPFVKDWTDKQKDDFTAPWTLTVIKGQKYGFHYDHRINGVNYRADLLKNAGFEYPKNLWEMAEQAAKLTDVPNMIGFTRGLNKRVPVDNLEESTPIAFSEGGAIVHEDGKAAINSEAWAKTLGFWQKIVNDYKALPLDLALQDSDQQYSVLLAGKSVFHMQMSHRLQHARDKSGLGEKIQFGALPSFKDNIPSPALVLGWILVIPKGSKNAPAAFKLIEQYTSPDMQAHLSEKAGYIPVRVSALEFPWFGTPEAKDIKKMVEIAKKRSLSTVIPEHYLELYTFLGEAFEEVMMNPKADPMQALNKAAENYNSKVVK